MIVDTQKLAKFDRKAGALRVLANVDDVVDIPRFVIAGR